MGSLDYDSELIWIPFSIILSNTILEIGGI